MKHKRASGTPHPVSTVSVRVKRLGQFFNSLDPSPFWDRDLDNDAAAFVETEFRDRPRDRAWVLNIATTRTPAMTRSALYELAAWTIECAALPLRTSQSTSMS